MVKVSFKKNSMSLGLVVLEEKLFTRTRKPQSDEIMSPDPRSNLTTQKDSQPMISYRLVYHPKTLGPIIREI